MNLWAVWNCSNQTGQDMDCMLGGEEAYFSFQIASMVVAAVCGLVMSWCKTPPFVSIPLCLLQMVGFNYSTIPCTTDHLSMMVVLEDGTN